MNMKLKNRILLIIYLCSILSCGYYSTKGSIPSHIKSLSIDSIINETPEYYIEESFEETLLNMLIEKNILKIQNSNLAHSHLYASIKTLSDEPFSYSSAKNSSYEKVEEYRIMVEIDVRWFDRIDNLVLFEKKFKDWGIYVPNKDISNDNIDNDGDGKIDSEDLDEFGSPRESAIRIAVNKISEDVIDEILLTW